jgi:hypothetical protein
VTAIAQSVTVLRIATQGEGAAGRKRPEAALKSSLMDWQGVHTIDTQEWRCGFCDREVASDRGWQATGYSQGFHHTVARVVLCPRCNLPSLIDSDSGAVVPPERFGQGVDHMPDDLTALYNEARRAVTSGAPNSAALACRKILMHVGVQKGAAAGGTFLSYVNYLSEHGFVPPDARGWVDEIRELGNDANHEIDLISEDEAKDVVEFTAMLLRVIYEYPERGRQARAAREDRRP